MIAVLLAIALFAPAQADEPAKLAITDRQPLVVRGTGFEPGERVLVIAAAGRSADVRVTANRDGVFVVRFAFSVPRCGSAWVRATGGRGTQARLALRKTLACVSPTSSSSR